MNKPTRKQRKSQTKMLPLAAIVIDAGLQPRAGGLSEEHVADLVEAIQRKDRLSLVVVFCDSAGRYWLASGFHRAEAFRRAGRGEVPCEVRPGERADALVFACGSNREHNALRRTNDDKRRAVELMVEAFPDWSNPMIGEAVGVSTELVRKLRPSGSGTREGADGKKYPAVRGSNARQSATVADCPITADIDSRSCGDPSASQPAQPPSEPRRVEPGPTLSATADDAKRQDAENAARVTAQLFAELKPIGDKHGRKLKELLSRLPREQVNRTAARHGLRVRDDTDGKPELSLLNAITNFLFDLEMGVDDDTE